MEFNKNRDKFRVEDVENNWAISYGDMITLLLAFFVLFFNIKTETVNLQLIKKDIDKFFKTSKVGRTPSAIPQTSMKNQNPSVSPVYSTDVANALKINSNIEGESILIEFPGIPFFPSASDQLTEEGKQALSDFAKAISSHLGAFRLVVRGYTDNRPLKNHKRYQDNLELSAFRSISAIRFLSQEGIDLQFMRIAGYGETDLSTQRAPEQVSMMDRKVVIVIEPLDQTERVALKSNKPDSIADKKPIEEVAAAKVVKKERKKKSSLYSSLSQKGFVVYQDIRKTVDEKFMGVSRFISNNSYYKNYLNGLIKKKLAQKGYSQNQIEDFIRDLDKKGVRQ